MSSGRGRQDNDKLRPVFGARTTQLDRKQPTRQPIGEWPAVRLPPQCGHDEWLTYWPSEVAGVCERCGDSLSAPIAPDSRVPYAR
jgi:hypothetical protein